MTDTAPLPRNRHEAVAYTALHRVQDVELRVAIGALFASAQELATDGAIGMVVLAARRLVCLYELLVRKGMPPISGCLVVSDRYLDTNPSLVDLLGESSGVLVLDDSVVLGSTLFKLTERLAGAVGPAGSVRSRAVCVDDDQVAEFLFEGLDHVALYRRPADKVQAFASQIVVALFEEQLPFFADFPVTRPVVCSAPTWERTLSSTRWHVADVTAPGFDETGAHAVALIPTSESLHDLLSRCVPEAAALIDAVKVRCYIGRTEDGLRIVFVPIAIIAPATPGALDTALSAVASELMDRGTAIDLQLGTWKPQARHRFLQLYASVCVLAEFWPELRNVTGDASLGSDLLEELPVELYFGDSAAEVERAFDAVVAAYANTKAGKHPPPPRVRVQQPPTPPYLLDEETQQVLWAAQELIERTGVAEAPAQGELTKTGLIFSHAISSVFGFVNETYELPQRAEIRRLGSVGAYREWLGDGRRRVLSHGVTLGELARYLLPPELENTAWGRSLVSLGIDEGNDLGIMVPVTLYDERRGLVFRCYRIGETAQLAACPLIRAVAGQSLARDHFINAMLQGQAAQPTTRAIRDFFSEREVVVRTSQDVAITAEQLALLVREAVPGIPVERYEGTVVSVGRGVVHATLLNPAEDDPRSARIPTQRIPAEWRKTLQSGMRFTMTTFEHASPGRLRRSREIKMRPRPVIDLEQLERNVHALQPDPDGDDVG